MGGAASQPNLEALSAEALADLVATVGEEYAGYKDAFVANAVTGAVFAALDDAGLAAKLAELGVANAAHVDALMDAIKRLKPASLAEFEGMPETQYFKVIHSAIRWQKPNVADLLTHPGTVECLDAQTGNTPIHIAAQNGYTDVVRVLIERGCNVNVKNNKGNMPMHMAMAYDYFEAVDALLAAGADPSIANEGGFAAETGLEGNKSFAFKVWCLHSTHHPRVDMPHLLHPPGADAGYGRAFLDGGVRNVRGEEGPSHLFPPRHPTPIRPPLGSHNHPFSSHPVAQDTLEKSAFVALCLKRKKELGAAWPDRCVTPHVPLRPCVLCFGSPSRCSFPPHGQRQGPHDGGDGDAAGQVSKEGHNSYHAFVHSIRWTVKLSLISLVRQLVDSIVVDIGVVVLLI
jgi:hypothetical protein